MISAHLIRASQDVRMRRDDLRALVQAHNLLDWEEYRPLKVAVVAHVLRLRRAHASRAIHRLVKFGYLVPGPSDGRINTYRLRTPPAADGSISGTSRAA